MQKERKGSKMKKLLAMATSLALLATSAIVPMTAAAAEEKEVTKPEKITIMVDTTLVNQANGRDAFEARWEKLTGIDLVINQPDHSAYYDVMQQTMADPDQWPDVLIMSSTYYSDFAANGALWDMTEAWENSNTKNSGRFTGDSVIEGLKINGHLYGFSPARGNGCVTYVKKAWMDKAGITKAPTNWEEYAAMLDAFSKLGVDGKTTYGTSAAGFIGNEAPYTNYLPEFYQDAYPSFILKDGVYVDGFTQPEMEAALARLKEGYDKGWIDPTTLTNSTKDCRNKFYDEQFGVFTRAELESRSEIMYETYTKVISIEARTMLHMAGKHYIPAVVRNCTRLADSVCKVHTACPAAPTGVQETLLCQTSELLTKAASAEHHLEGLVEQLGRMDNVHDMAVFCHDMIMPAMQDLRDPIDRLELIVDKDIWPVPTYGDLMFEV